MGCGDRTDGALPGKPEVAAPRETQVTAGTDYPAPAEPQAPLGMGPGPERADLLARRRDESAWGRFAELVRFEQTLFALPFAYAGAVLAAGGLPSLWQMFWISLAMVGARTAGMGANRIIDREIDARNPRTWDRALPAGRVSVASVVLVTAFSSAMLVVAAWMLNPLCLRLAPLAVGLLLGYSYLKRFTWGSHLGLGLVQACAPLGGWLAVTGRFALAPVLLGTAIFLWVAGFDMLYACQDLDVDRSQGLHSVPARFGPERAFAAARSFHLGTMAALTLVGVCLGLGGIYYAGVGLIGAILVWEHSLLAPDDLSRIQQAFFVANALVSLSLLLAVLLEVLL